MTILVLLILLDNTTVYGCTSKTLNDLFSIYFRASHVVRSRVEFAKIYTFHSLEKKIALPFSKLPKFLFFKIFFFFFVPAFKSLYTWPTPFREMSTLFHPRLFKHISLLTSFKWMCPIEVLPSELEIKSQWASNEPTDIEIV